MKVPMYIYICTYEGASGIAIAGYDVVYRLMEMKKLLDNCHHLFTDNLFTTSAAANYLLGRGTFNNETKSAPVYTKRNRYC